MSSPRAPLKCIMKFQLFTLAFSCQLPPPPPTQPLNVRDASPALGPPLIDATVVAIECVSSAVRIGQTGRTVLCIECVFVVRLPQSFIKGSTLKGQLNYSLLTGGGEGGGPLKRRLAWQCCYLAMLTPTLPPLLNDESRSLFPKLINKRASPLTLCMDLQQTIPFFGCLCCRSIHASFCLSLLCVCVCAVQGPSTSVGDESALHRFSLHAAHLGEVHPLLRASSSPLTLLLGFLNHRTWTKQQTEQQP